MKTKWISLFACFTALVALSGFNGCNDLTTPQSTLGSAYNDVVHSDLNGLREALSGDALTTYGNAAGMAKLAKMIAGQDLQVGQAWYYPSLSDTTSPKKHFDVYTVELLGKQEGCNDYRRVFVADISCEWDRNPHHRQPRVGYDADIVTDTTDCTIYNIR